MEEKEKENVSGVLPEHIRQELRKPLPRKAIGKHPTKPFLSTIKSIYIVERLNEVFGIGGWKFLHEIVKETNQIFYDGNGKVRAQIPYIVAAGKIVIPKYGVETPIQYGGHQTAGKNTEPADGYKSSITDCLSKCASYLEVGIDVFKGEPFVVYDKNGNIKPEYDTKPVEVEIPERTIEKKKYEPIKASDELREKYKEMFGRYPNKTWGDETISAKIENEKIKRSKKEKEEPKPVDDDEVIDVTETQKEEDDVTVDSFIKKIRSFKTTDEILSNAENIVFEATVAGLTDDDILLLKQATNEYYKELKNKQ